MSVARTSRNARSRKGSARRSWPWAKNCARDARENFATDRTYYGITGLVRFEKGRRCVISFADPLNVETVPFEGKTFPLAADFTVPLAVMLARENPKKLELARALRPEKYANTARIARLQPYDPNKTVVLVIHGLVDSPATWAPMLNDLRGDPFIRQHYQFWFFSYPSGYPYPYSAALLRARSRCGGGEVSAAPQDGAHRP
ncbi:MAG: hypothetical protein WDN28_12190 [Chthoniobacter sp.]